MFEDSYIKFTKNGLILLRNKFEYEIIDKEVIKHMVLKRGFHHQNWMLLFVVGVVFITLCIRLFVSVDFVGIFGYSNSELEMSFKSYFTIIVSIVVFFVLSIFLLISSLRRSDKLYITYRLSNDKTKKKTISLRDFKKTKQLNDLIEFLKKENYCFEDII